MSRQSEYARTSRGKATETKRQKSSKRKAWKKTYVQTARYKTSQRNDRMKRAYGITLAQFEMLSNLQRHACAICERKLKLHVDHDHKTGDVRGLLCSTCNTGIGQLQDSAAVAKAAAMYLESNHEHAKLVQDLM